MSSDDDYVTLDDYSKKNNPRKNNNSRNNNIRNRPNFNNNNNYNNNRQRGNFNQRRNRPDFNNSHQNNRKPNHISGQVYYTKEEREEYKRKKLEKIQNIQQEIKEDLKDLPISQDKVCPRKELDDEQDSEFRQNCIHIYGMDFLSTQEIKEYFKDYEPQSVEWIDDSSCNLLFKTSQNLKDALKNLTQPSENNVEDDQEEEQENKFENIEQLKQWHYLKPIHKRGIDLVLEVRMATRNDIKPWSQKGQDSQFYKRYNTVVTKKIIKTKEELAKIRQENKEKILEKRKLRHQKNNENNSDIEQDSNNENDNENSNHSDSDNNEIENQNQEQNENSELSQSADEENNQNQNQSQNQESDDDDNL